MLIPYSFGTKIKNKKFVGIRPCSQCGQFSEYWLCRTVYRVAICWIPIISIPQKRYLRCDKCGAAAELSKEKFNAMREEFADMPRVSLMRKAYEQIKSIANEMAPEARSVDAIYTELTKRIRIEEGAPRYRELIETYLGCSAAMNPKQETAPAAEAAAEPAPAAAETAAAETAPAAVSEAASEPLVKEIPDAVKAPENLPSLSSENEQPKFVAQRLWLLAAIPFVLLTVFMAAVCISAFAGDSSDILAEIIVGILVVGIPAGLTALFGWLAFRKKKN